MYACYLSISQSEYEGLLRWPHEAGDCTLKNDLVTDHLLLSPEENKGLLVRSKVTPHDWALSLPLLSNAVDVDDIVRLPNSYLCRVWREGQC